MNKFAIAAAALLLSTSALYAGGLTYGGYGEYAVEADSFELGATAGYSFDFGVDASVTVVGLSNSTNSFEYDHTDLRVAYNIGDNVDLYSTVTMNSDFEYDEAVVGVSLSF